MNDFFSEQKDILVAIKHEISLLYQQVDYLIRHEKPLDILDLDVMMNRTHTIYDHLCSVDAGAEIKEESPSDDEELEVDPNLIRAAFGIAPETTTETAVPEDETLEEALPAPEEETIQEEELIPEEAEEDFIPEEEEQIVEEDSVPEEEEGLIPEETFTPEKDFVPSEETIVPEENDLIPEESDLTPEDDFVSEEEEPVEEEPVAAPTDDFGFILNFEPAEEKESFAEEKKPLVEPPVAAEKQVEEDFELEVPETLGERLQHQEDHSLAAKLQNRSVNDLRNAIGINDKFLLVNELFGGSMEKYNKSIENLNDLKTLNGAIVYMNELRIDLAWNTSNEAYKKLLDLVHQKFQN